MTDTEQKTDLSTARKEIAIGPRWVGEGHPVFTVAEIGSNHCRDKGVVFKLIDHAAEAGFDAVKFQTYDPEDVFSGNITTEDVHLNSIYGSRPWWEVAKNQVLMPREWFGETFNYAREKQLLVFSTVHSVEDAEFILRFDPPALKIASLDVSHTDFLLGLGKFKKPVIMSTGMHTRDEIQFAVRTLRDSGIGDIILLHCVSAYPPSPVSLNLNNIPMLRRSTGLPVGFSDHSTGTWAAAAATALGACMIEKHITLDRRLRGPDHHFALEPAMMKELIQAIRNTEKSLGSHDRVLSEEETATRTLARRSLVASGRIMKGEVLSRRNLKVSRPGSGIHPRYFNELIGKKAKRTIEKEDLIDWSDIE